MSDSETKPQGVLITLREIHTAVLSIDDKIDREVRALELRISALEAKIAAYGVVIGIMSAVITAVAVMTFTQ